MWSEVILYMPATREAMIMSNQELYRIKKEKENENNSYTIYIE